MGAPSAIQTGSERPGAAGDLVAPQRGKREPGGAPESPGWFVRL